MPIFSIWKYTVRIIKIINKSIVISITPSALGMRKKGMRC